MRLVLSRKGFDSGTGRKPSPIFEDGRMLSLPIPERGSSTTYDDISWNGQTLGPLVEALTKGRVRGSFGAHLDPDLDRDALTRQSGWKPAFGQVGAAQSVLEREGVGVGDLFLFFGWFRRVETRSGQPSYVKGAPDLHVLFGWLQVGEVLRVESDPLPKWARDHPHVARPDRKSNSLYVSAPEVVLDGVGLGVAGGGSFPVYHRGLCLTAPGGKRSSWDLPGWFHPGAKRPALGYHSSPERWSRRGDRTSLQCVPRGQEFVLDTAYYPEATDWIRELLPNA